MEEGIDMMNNNSIKTEDSIKRKEELVDELIESLANELYIEPEDIDVESSFMEMGLDSIIGVEWVRSINKKYGSSISTTKIYQYPNILEFAKYMESELAGNNVIDSEQPEVPVMRVEKATVSQELDDEKLVAELIESLAEELYMEPEEIDVEASFTEMGLDSIIGVEWIRSINKKYGCTISTTKVYQYSNVLEFAQYLKQELNIQTHDTEDNSHEVRQAADAQKDLLEKKETSQAQNTIDSEKIMNELIESLAEELYMEPEEIDVDSSFTEMGLDSIIAVEWIRSINKRYNLSINTTKIYQYPDLASFCKFMLEALADGCEEYSAAVKSDSNNNNESNKNGELEHLLWQVYQGEVEVDDAKDFFK